MFRAIKNLVALISLISTALVACKELRKAWTSIKGEQAGQTTYRTSEYSGPTPGTNYSGYSS